MAEVAAAAPARGTRERTSASSGSTSNLPAVTTSSTSLWNLGPEFDTPNGAEKNHPVMTLLEDYDTVKKSDFLAEYGQKFREPHPTQTIPGVEERGGEVHRLEQCARCVTRRSTRSGKKTKHAKAYDDAACRES